MHMNVYQVNLNKIILKQLTNSKNYVQKNFYDTNYITIKNVQTKSNVYTCTANIKSRVGVAADDMDKNFIIKVINSTNKKVMHK